METWTAHVPYTAILWFTRKVRETEMLWASVSHGRNLLAIAAVGYKEMGNSQKCFSLFLLRKPFSAQSMLALMCMVMWVMQNPASNAQYMNDREQQIRALRILDSI